MNVLLPEKEGLRKRSKIIYGTIISICIIALIVAFYIQFYARIDFSKLVGINKDLKYGNKTEEEIEELRTGLLEIFDNRLENTEGNNSSKKEDESKDLVYTYYEKKDIAVNDYDIEVHIPKINIRDDIISEYNKEIEDIFLKTTEKTLKTKNKNVIYSVDYTANLQNGILSVIIYSNFKQGTNAQRVIIKTYNYDIRNNKEITLSEIINIENLDKELVQQQINTEIDRSRQRVSDLEKLGLTVFGRNPEDDMYDLENTEEFYITNNVIYIIYPYGNNNSTTEKDIVIL